MITGIDVLGYFNCGVLSNEDCPFIVDMNLDRKFQLDLHEFQYSFDEKYFLNHVREGYILFFG